MDLFKKFLLRLVWLYSSLNIVIKLIPKADRSIFAHSCLERAIKAQYRTNSELLENCHCVNLHKMDFSKKSKRLFHKIFKRLFNKLFVVTLWFIKDNASKFNQICFFGFLLVKKTLEKTSTGSKSTDVTTNKAQVGVELRHRDHHYHKNRSSHQATSSKRLCKIAKQKKCNDLPSNKLRWKTRMT